jgi:molybdenum cofactor cytidylyltransferase
MGDVTATPTPRPPRVVALILAAGASTRFGSDKRQALLPDGQSVLEAVLFTHRQVLDEIWVLTRPGDAFGQRMSEAHGARQVACGEAMLGQGHTLATGLKMLTTLHANTANANNVDAALVSLADMPWVQAQTLQSLIKRFATTGRVVLPRHGKTLGHPRLLPRAVWPLLLGKLGGEGLEGDRGAQSLLNWSAAEQVPVNDPGVLRDVDTPADIPSQA